MADNRNESSLSPVAGTWLGWFGIILAIIGFFWQPVWMGVLAIVLGIIGVTSPKKGLNWTAIVLGALALIIGMF